ncbi:MAG: cobalamin-binding protein [Acidobacteriota bacterium]
MSDYRLIESYRLVVVIVVAMMLTSCSQSSSSSPNAISTDKASLSAHRTVTDELGRTVTIVSEPKRIISLAPNITEILFALDLGPRIVGVTTYCNYPPQATTIDKVGDTLRPNLEQIIALHPDLVLISTASQLQQFLAKLTEAGIPIFVLKSPSVEATLHSIVTVGQLTNRETQAKALVNQLRGRLATIAEKVAGKPRPKVFFVVGTEPLITAGRDAFITDLINFAGGDSISADVAAEWPAYSAETVIARAPDIILVPGWHANEQASDEKNGLKLPPGLEVTPAVRNGRTHTINPDLILRPGPRIVDGLAEMARLFHPEAAP